MPRRRSSRAAYLLLMSLALIFAGCSGGHDDLAPPEPPASFPPSVSAVSPTEVPTGGAAFTLTVRGANFVAGSTVQWGGSDRATTFVSASQLSAAIAAADVAQTGTVAVTVVNPAGGGSSSSMSVIIGNPVPSVTTLVPAAAFAAGGNLVLTVSGSGFLATSVIQWNGSARPTTFVNATALQAPIPASDIAAAGTVPVAVLNPGPAGGISNAAAFTVNNPAPTIAAVSPTFMPPGAAAFDLTVDGTGFVTTTVERWNGADRPTAFVSATRVLAAISAGDVAGQGVGQVIVFNATPGGGISNAAVVSIGNPVPQISGLDPAIVRPGAPAFTLRVLGSSYVPGAVARLNGIDLATTVVGPGELNAPIAAADVATAGTAQIVALNPAPGGGASNPATLTIAPFGVTERISVASDGSEANGASDSPSISADGRYVAFTSDASNLVAADTNDQTDVFVSDTCAGAAGCTPSTSRISLANDGSEANGANGAPSISGDGRFVAFTSSATNLVAADGNGVVDVFVRDTCVGASGPCTPSTSIASVGDNGQDLFASTSPSISRDGRFVAFVSKNILVLSDVNGTPDAFVRDTCAGAAAGCVPSTSRVSVVTDTLADNLGVSGASIDDDGRFVAFLTFQRAPGANFVRSTLYVVDACTGASAGCTPVTVLADSVSSTNGGLGLYSRALSDDGRFVTYTIASFGAETVWLADTCIGATAGCVVPSAQVSGSALLPVGAEATPSSNGTGRFVAHVVYEGGRGIAVIDTCVGAPPGCVRATVKVSETTAGVAGNQDSFVPTIDATGRWVAFTSDANNLVPGDTNGKRDVFLALTGR